MIRIFRSIPEVPSDFGPCVTTIGNFDGVHVGHQTLMKRVVEISRQTGYQSAVLTFYPHPAKVVAPDRAPKIIMTVDQRAAFMSELGIEEVLILPFTESVSRLSPEEFVKTVLVDCMRVRTVLVGEDFRFGYQQAGDTRMLTGFGARYGFTVELIPPVNVRGDRASSTLVRQMAAAGRISRVCRVLGRPFVLDGPVVKGHGIGARQTVPTLNLQPETEVWPAKGVYVTHTLDLNGARSWPSVTNIGIRPTFGGDHLSVETFLLDPLAGPSPERIRVSFLWRIREERKFASPQELKAQILRDVAVAQKYFQRTLEKGRITG